MHKHFLGNFNTPSAISTCSYTCIVYIYNLCLCFLEQKLPSATQKSTNLRVTTVRIWNKMLWLYLCSTWDYIGIGILCIKSNLITGRSWWEKVLESCLPYNSEYRWKHDFNSKDNFLQLSVCIYSCRVQHIESYYTGDKSKQGVKLGAFDNSQEDWMTHIDRLQLYFTANNIHSDPKQRAILLSICRPSTYTLLWSSCCTMQTDQKYIWATSQQIGDHYSLKPSVTVQWYNFHSRSRQQGEIIASYVAELGQFSEHCEFSTLL